MRRNPAESWDALREKLLVAPSLLSADFARLAQEIAIVERAGAQVLHLDVMDGHFVPNITFGPPLVATIRRETDLWLDAHLMVSDPLRFLEPFAKAGAGSITIHAEVLTDPASFRAEADRLGIRLGLAIRPDTPIEAALRASGSDFDLILVMTVMPGFGGQAFLEGSCDRIEAAAAFCSSAPRRPVLEVDGGIGPATVAEAVRAGARWFVSGNAIFRSPDPAAAFRDLQASLDRHTVGRQ